MGLKMVSEYVSYTPPRNVGMTMVSGPWFFENFGGGGWRFTPGRRRHPGSLEVHLFLPPGPGEAVGREDRNLAPGPGD